MRNFFHDISAVLLAAFIVLIAAGVIFWRMNVILEYPEKLAGAANRTQVEETADGAEDADANANADANADADADAGAEDKATKSDKSADGDKADKKANAKSDKSAKSAKSDNGDADK